MAHPLSPDQYRQTPWAVREYIDLHLAVLARHGNLLDLLQRRHAALLPPTVKVVGERKQPHVDLLVEVMQNDLSDALYQVECKSEQHHSANSSIELLANIKPDQIRIELGWRSGKIISREEKPSVFAKLAEVLAAHPEKHGLGLARLPAKHYTSLWRRGKDSTCRLVETRQLQAAIQIHLSNPNAQLALSDMALLVLIPDHAFDLEPFRSAVVKTETDISALEMQGDQALVLAWQEVDAKRKAVVAKILSDKQDDGQVSQKKEDANGRDEHCPESKDLPARRGDPVRVAQPRSRETGRFADREETPVPKVVWRDPQRQNG